MTRPCNCWFPLSSTSRRGDCAGAVQHFALAGEVLDSQPSALRQYAACLVLD
jgi:hypothetical protein